MKKIFIAALATLSIALAVTPCCPNEEDVLNMSEISCSSDPSYNIPLNCTNVSGSPNFLVIGDMVRDSCGSLLETDMYCIVEVYRDESNFTLGTEQVLWACDDSPNQYSFDAVQGILLMISTIFLIATIAIHISLPELRDLQGMCYVLMCFSMALGFLFMAILDLSNVLNEAMCTLAGFLAHTWMIATFFWINVVSFNMCRIIRDSSHRQKTVKCQDYIWYHGYAWGCTTIVTTLTVVAHLIEGDHWSPGFGKRNCGNCWFGGLAEDLIFFHGPIAVLITVNFVLFVLSLISLWRTNKLIFKEKFLRSVKLFFVMGMPWVFEIVSFVDGRWFWIYFEPFNHLQGVILFFVLVVSNKRAMQALRRRE